MQPVHWSTSRFELDLSAPKVMGIVNITPDSFSDGGQHATTATALAHAERLVAEGADILDLGGESTRPGSVALGLQDELDRVLPVLKVVARWGVPVSIDTYKPEVMQAALDAGADIINDIWALRQGDALGVVAAHPRCGICLMHMHRDPQTMQLSPMADPVLPAVKAFLAQRADALRAAGVAANRVVLDPGIGFGKTVRQNFSLLAQQPELLSLGYPVLAAWSRKSSLGQVTGHERPADRQAASVAAALLALERGARVLRVHDVRATVDALRVWQACQT